MAELPFSVENIEPTRDQMRGLVAFHCEWLGLTVPRVEFIDGRKSCCQKRADDFHIEFAQWPVDNTCPGYCIWLAVHETIHMKHTDHSSVFHALEGQELGIWGLRVEYAKAYPKAIYRGDELVCGPQGGRLPSYFEPGDIVSVHMPQEDKEVTGIVKRVNQISVTVICAEGEGGFKARCSPDLVEKTGDNVDLREVFG